MLCFHKILISVHDVAAWSHIRQASDSARWMGFLSGAHGDTKISILSPGRRSCSVYQLLPTWIKKRFGNQALHQALNVCWRWWISDNHEQGLFCIRLPWIQTITISKTTTVSKHIMFSH